MIPLKKNFIMRKRKTNLSNFYFFQKKILSILVLSLVICFSLYAQNATIQFQIIDDSNGRLTPARLTILKDGLPYNVEIESKLNIASRVNTIYTSSGTGSIQLPKGKYEFWFGRGMEYSVDVQQVNIKNDSTLFLTAHLQKELNTDGFISGDLHLHTYTNSGHGDSNLPERIISCAAEGLDWVVSTDHNFITDYEPYMREAGLFGLMQTTVGNEVSTPIGHFNTFPLYANSKPVKSDIKNGNVLLETIRSHSKDDVFIQINHPRWVATDYFNTKGLDIYFGTVSKKEEWSWDFDGYEVLNENYQLGWTTAPDNLQSVKRDWFNMQNRGKRATGIGNSDSHTVVSAIAGVPRNYIVSSTDVPSEIDEKEISQNLKNQQVSVACGILPQIFVKGKNALGETFPSRQTSIPLQLKVQAASWISCSKAELLKNGIVVKSFDLQRNGSAVCLDTIVNVKPSKDSWYVLIAYGDQPMFPMVGKLERPVKPLGFTNPVWIDADGDGKIQSVFDQAKKLVLNNSNNINSFTKTLRAEPEMIPFAFYHLFSEKNKNAIPIAQAFLKDANTEQKRMLFRELAKTEMDGAQKVLNNFLKEKLTPLEEVVLASFVYFPIRENRVTNFKKRKNSKLDEQLNYLETKFTYINSGAVPHKGTLGWSSTNQLPKEWKEIHSNENTFFQLPKISSGSHFLKSNWKMRRDTNLYFYLNSDQEITYWVNGKKVKTIPSNHNLEFNNKIFPFFLKKGNNELILQIASKQGGNIAFHPANEDMLLDPQMEIKEVNHLGRYAKVAYLTKYSYKYHGFGDALTDGYRGTKNFKDQLWQGWEGENVEVVLDLGKEQTVREIQLGILVSQSDWIFAPSHVDFLISNDGKKFTPIFSEDLDALSKASQQFKTVGGKISSQKIRFIKVVAKKIEALPEWHAGKGQGAWMFLDEIMVR